MKCAGTGPCLVVTDRNSAFLCHFLRKLKGELLTSESGQPERSHRVDLLETLSTHQRAQGNMTRRRGRGREKKRCWSQRWLEGWRQGTGDPLAARLPDKGARHDRCRGMVSWCGQVRELRAWKAKDHAFSSHCTRAFSMHRTSQPVSPRQ